MELWMLLLMVRRDLLGMHHSFRDVAHDVRMLMLVEVGVGVSAGHHRGRILFAVVLRRCRGLRERCYVLSESPVAAGTCTR